MTKRLFLVNYYLLHVPRLPSQPAGNAGGWVIDFIWLELAWKYIAMTRNNLSIIWISLVRWPSQKRNHHKFMAHCGKVFVLILKNNKVLLRSYGFGNSGHMLRNPKVADRDIKNLRCKDQSVCVSFNNKLDCCCLKKGSVVTCYVILK